MYGRVTNCIKCLNFLSDETLGYGGSAVALFKKKSVCFLMFCFRRHRNKCQTRAYMKKKEKLPQFIERQELRLRFKENQIILWPLGSFGVMHTKLKVIKTHASGTLWLLVGSVRTHPLLTPCPSGQVTLVMMKLFAVTDKVRSKRKTRGRTRRANFRDSNIIRCIFPDFPIASV